MDDARSPDLVTTEPQRADHAPDPADGSLGEQRINLRTLVDLRWVATCGQFATLVIVYFVVGFHWGLLIASLILLSSGLFTWHGSYRRVRNRRQVMIADREAARFLALDILQILLLLALTGGIVNPFCVLILAPVTVSASVLSRKSTLALSILAVAGITLITYLRLPLPWAAAPVTLPIYYTSAIWVSLVLGAVFMTLYIFSMADAARRMNRAVSETERALFREQRLSAMGGLAAAAAHELGTPLATIAVVAREMQHALADQPRLQGDAQLLVEEAARCRTILSELARDPREDQGAAFLHMPVETLVRLAAEPYQRRRVQFDVVAEPAGLDELSAQEPGMLSGLDFGQPQLPRDPQIIKGLGNLLQNAFEFARSQVLVECRWTDTALLIVILDDGPGIDPGIERRLGEPYVHGDRGAVVQTTASGKLRSSMGLGVFIAKSLLAQRQATVTFHRNPAGWGDLNEFSTGTAVVITWDRTKLEA